MTDKDKLYAFPIPSYTHTMRGMELRDYFAAKAMQGMLADSAYNGSGVAVEVPDKKIGFEYHISITKMGMKRCDSNEAKWVLRQFGLDGWEEDNHVPYGVARHFWRPVAENLVGLECKCKADEPEIVEDKGDYIWRPDNSAL